MTRSHDSTGQGDKHSFYQRHLLAEALCGHSLWRDIQHAAGELPGPIVFKDELRALRSKLGKSHEDQWIERLTALGVQVVEIGQTGSDEEREERTLAAIKQGAEAVHGGRISHGRWNGEPDLLIRSDVIRRLTGHATASSSTPQPTSIGAHRYEAADVKLSGELAVTALLQVALYAELIDAIQGIAVTDRREHQMHFFLGSAKEEAHASTLSPELKGLRSLSAASFGAYTRRHMQRVELAWDANGDQLPQEPEPVKYCDRCSWERNCDAVWRDKRDLVLVSGLRKDERRALRATGISTVGELAVAGDTAERAIPVKDRREHLMRQADLQEKSLDLPEPLSELRPPTRGIFEREEVRRGFAALPSPAALNIYMDFERYDFNEREEGGLETKTVLTGFVVNGPNLVAASGSYAHSLAEIPSQEERLFVDFVEQLSITIAIAESDGTVEVGAEVPVFHFSPFEPSTFRRLVDEYGIGQEVYDRLRWVDLRDITVRVATIGVERYSLKELEQITKFTRTIPLKEVKLPAIAYFKYLVAEDPEEKQSNLDTLRGYNEDDCRSLIALHAWLESIRAAYGEQFPDTEWGPLPSPRKEKKNTEKALKMQAEYAALQLRLKAAEAAHRERIKVCESEENAAGAEWHRWCADLAGFYARERVASFMDKMHTYQAPGHSLHDEPKAIGHLRREDDGSYSFPPQLVTLEPDDKVEAIVGAEIIEGSITTLDLASCKVWVNWGEYSPKEHPTSIIEGDTFYGTGPEEAMADFSEAALLGPDAVPLVTRQLLYRVSPTCLTAIDAAMPGSDRGLEAAKQIQAGDVLVVQGPPGTGKSHLGGRIISALVQRGDSVAVTTQSHAAYQIPIRESGVAVQQVRIAQRGSPIWKQVSGEKLGDWIRDQSGAVSGGTRYTFSHVAVADAFDVLIVDEAGQYSMADLVGISRCAKKVILLGDPQQLPMVTQGHHPPGPSGISTMSHWLGDDVQTVQPADGVFLERTYRLHPGIADFIGDTFYEGRLTAALPEQERQAVTLDGESAPLGPLLYLNVDHSHEGAWSLEEAERIAEFVHTLVTRGTITHRDGSTTRFSSAAQEVDEDPLLASDPDILIIAPYSAQVERIEYALGERMNRADGVDLRPYVRIQTVDKAQGDQAHVVIYSMTRASVQGARHGADFVLSANRFNVAVSRARALAVAVASPKLLDEVPSSLKHVRSLNPFAAFLENSI
jgi:uncharacterized protein